MVGPLTWLVLPLLWVHKEAKRVGHGAPEPWPDPKKVNGWIGGQRGGETNGPLAAIEKRARFFFPPAIFFSTRHESDTMVRRMVGSWEAPFVDAEGALSFM
jgi:hypothetical protein